MPLSAMKFLSYVKGAIQVCHLPNTIAVAKRIATPTVPEAHWLAYAKACIQPGYDYFREKFDRDLLPVVEAFKAARLFLPAKINDIKPDSSTVDTLKAFKFLGDQVITKMKSELPTYLSLAENLSYTVDPLQWWERNSEKIPFWASCCKKIVLCQPTSASVERVFSLLKQFNEQQQSSLEDYIEVALMVR